MSKHQDTETSTGILRLCAVNGQDRVGCTALLQRPEDDGTRNALDALEARWGTFPAEGATRPEGVAT